MAAVTNLITSVEELEHVSTVDMLTHYHEKAGLNDVMISQINKLGVEDRYLMRGLGGYDPQDLKETEHHGYHLAKTGNYCKADTSLKIDNLIVASEIADFQTPGIAATLLPDLKLSRFTPTFNLQGTACSSMPRCIELAKNLKGNTLCIIDGITSDMYQRELQQLSHVQPKLPSWIKLMFGMLFGDATAAFMVSPASRENGISYRLGPQAHVMNLDSGDYKKAAVKRGIGFDMYADPRILDTALHYTDVVLTKLGIETFDHYKRIILHTGSQKIIKGYQSKYDMTTAQLYGSVTTLRDYGNTTGCSLPFVLQREAFEGQALLIGITMGFGLDILEVTTN